MDDHGPARGRRRSVIRRGRNLPLAAWAAIGGVAIVVTIVVLVGAVLARGGLDRLEVLALGVGLLVGLVLVGFGVFWSQRVTAGLRELHADAVRRLRDPSLRVSTTAPQLVGAATEFADLARVLDALHLRARVADEVAEQSRRTAEQTSAGVFELLSGLVAAEEATRGQLSAELHDTVAQSLAVARSLLSEEDREHPDAGRIEKVRELVEDAEEQVRAVMARARPAALNDGDLASAVGALRREFATRYLVTVRLDWPEQAYPLPLVSAVTIYRFFQEALLNVVKHADVDDAEASLAVEGEQLVARVRDHGPGFVPSQVQSGGGRHVGLGLLRERARLAGGALDLTTAPGEGTELTLRLPLSPRSALGLAGGFPTVDGSESPLRVV
jgi:signal transduction histidine kinase